MLTLGTVCSSEKENRKEIYQNISVYNSSKKIGSKEMKKYIFLIYLHGWSLIHLPKYNNDNLYNAIYVMHITYHLVPQYLCDVGSYSHLSRPWHFLTCLDYLIWCLYSQGSLPHNSGSNKNQSTSSSSNTFSCVPSIKPCAFLFLLQNPVWTQEKTLFHCKKGEISINNTVSERIPARGHSTTSAMPQTHYHFSHFGAYLWEGTH